MKSDEIIALCQGIRLVAFDVDGIFTNGQLHFSDTGELYKTFHVHDGYAVQQLLTQGIEVAIISGRDSEITRQRFHTLGVKHLYLGSVDKKPAYHQLKQKLGLSDQAIAYMGDDLPDLPLLQQVGLSVTVPNAQPQVRQQAMWETQHPGGCGAVREFVEQLLRYHQATQGSEA